ncbi:hypothetical protein GQR58_027779 [Nymphon striatum]|nr:hypothetical protein GQR58_027779 [Nymphon striatum]
MTKAVITFCYICKHILATDFARRFGSHQTADRQGSPCIFAKLAKMERKFKIHSHEDFYATELYCPLTFTLVRFFLGKIIFFEIPPPIPPKGTALSRKNCLNETSDVIFSTNSFDSSSCESNDLISFESNNLFSSKTNLNVASSVKNTTVQCSSNIFSPFPFPYNAASISRSQMDDKLSSAHKPGSICIQNDEFGNSLQNLRSSVGQHPVQQLQHPSFVKNKNTSNSDLIDLTSWDTSNMKMEEIENRLGSNLLEIFDPLTRSDSNPDSLSDMSTIREVLDCQIAPTTIPPNPWIFDNDVVELLDPFDVEALQKASKTRTQVTFSTPEEKVRSESCDSTDSFKRQHKIQTTLKFKAQVIVLSQMNGGMLVSTCTASINVLFKRVYPIRQSLLWNLFSSGDMCPEICTVTEFGCYKRQLETPAGRAIWSL